MSRVRDVQTAKDLVQETCLKAFRAFDRFERGTDYKAWLFRILINSALDWHRRTARAAPLISLDGVDALSTVEAEPSAQTPMDPERRLLTKQLRAEIAAALTSLPPEGHAVIHLSFVEGYSYKEIGRILGCPIGTVMSRLYRARRALQGRLAHLVGEDGAAGSGRADNVQSIDSLRARLQGRPRVKDA